MARRQMELAGTRNEKDIPLVVVEAGDEWLAKRRDQRRAAEKTKEAKQGLIHLMQANKVSSYQVKDPDTGEYLDLNLEMKPKITTHRTGEAETAIGEAIAASGSPTNEPGVHPGLLREAEQAQADANVEETADGDVEVPDKAATKPAKKRKPKKRKPKKGGK